jgi:hypothetical protein
MSEAEILVTLGIVAVLAFALTRLQPRVGYSRGVVVTIAVVVIGGAVAMLLLSLSHPPLVEASGILHD